MKKLILITCTILIIWSCEMAPKENEFELKAMKTKEVVLQNFEFISSGDMDSFQNICQVF